MKKLGILVLLLSAAAAIQAQDKKSLFTCMAQKNILSHMDIGVNVGTVGVGIDVAVPVTNYVRIRAGYNYMPRFTIHSDFPIETRQGSISSAIQKLKGIDLKQMLIDQGIDIEQPKFKEIREDFDKFGNITPKDYVTMDLKPNLSQFNFLVDIMPFKNKHWSFTAGFFYGSERLGEALNQSQETQLLEAVTTYNKYYVRVCSQDGILGDGNGFPKFDNEFIDRGVAGFKLGKFKDGDLAIMIPGEDGMVQAEMKVNKMRPYVGLGYNTNLSHNKRWKLNVDAGVLIRCGKPSIYVNNVYKIDKQWDDSTWGKEQEEAYKAWVANQHDNYCYDIIRPNEDEADFVVDEPLKTIDMINDLDLNSIPGKVGDMTRLISKFKVYPNLSVTVSYRLF